MYFSRRANPLSPAHFGLFCEVDFSGHDHGQEVEGHTSRPRESLSSGIDQYLPLNADLLNEVWANG